MKQLRIHLVVSHCSVPVAPRRSLGGDSAVAGILCQLAAIFCTVSGNATGDSRCPCACCCSAVLDYSAPMAVHQPVVMTSRRRVVGTQPVVRRTCCCSRRRLVRADSTLGRVGVVSPGRIIGGPGRHAGAIDSEFQTSRCDVIAAMAN
jgi:hypothetical protein